MGFVLALSWTDEASEALARRVIAAAGRAGLTAVTDRSRGWIGTGGPRRPDPHDLKGGLLVLGDLVASGAEQGARPGGRLARLAGLTTSHWGRYLALDQDGDGTLRAVLRDPSGAREAATWTCAGVRVVSTGTPDWLIAAANPRALIAWDGVPSLLGDPLAGLAQPPLTGLVVLNAGEMIDLVTGDRRQVWHPVRPGQPQVWDRVRAGQALRARVRDTVTALGDRVDALGAELSGGLDSAIVAVALGSQRSRSRLWLNARSGRPETDERHHARAVAARLDVELLETQRVERPLGPEALAATAGDVRPGYNGADPAFDDLVAQACASRGVEGLMTGKGGDALFCQGASRAVFTDLWRHRGPLALISPAWAGTARWTRRSCWSGLRSALRPSARPEVGPATTASILSAGARVASGPRHPWLDGSEGLAPGKRLQLEALISNLAYATACRRTQVVDLIHPLMAQPLVEGSMRIPTPVLTAGRMDRHLARSVFAEHLPAQVAWRRSKADYTATFEREAAASLPFMRSHLLDGLLAGHGVIDRARTETLLDRDRLMWAGGGAELVSAAVVESWLRAWAARAG